MWILESVLVTILFEKLRPYFKRKSKNNKKVIADMVQTMPTFQTVGELKKLLTNFSDDVKITGSTFEYPLLQVRVIDDIGLIHLGSSTTLSKGVNT